MNNIFLPLWRIIMLQVLEREPGRELSNEMLQRALGAMGVKAGIGDVNAQVNWLEARGYVTAARLEESPFIIVRLTRAGVDAALGNVRAEGIDPPPEG